MKKETTWIIVLAILLSVSIILNYFLYFNIYVIDTEWKNSYNNLDKEWCDYSNVYIETINAILTELGNYDENYNNMLLNRTDCWSNDYGT